MVQATATVAYRTFEQSNPQKTWPDSDSRPLQKKLLEFSQMRSVVKQVSSNDSANYTLPLTRLQSSLPVSRQVDLALKLPERYLSVNQAY